MEFLVPYVTKTLPGQNFFHSNARKLMKINGSAYGTRTRDL